MGLRLGESLNLNVGDIDAQRMKVHIRQGKGGKDRFVTLPHLTLLALRRYWATHRHPQLIFPGGRTPVGWIIADDVMSRGGVQQAFKAIVHSCGIHKSVSIHSLRHCYGAHLTEIGVHLRAIQHEMGHESPKTTALYTQLTDVATQTATDQIAALMVRLTIQWQEA